MGVWGGPPLWGSGGRGPSVGSWVGTHACMVVEAVWKLNMFSLGNQLLSSAEEKEQQDSKRAGSY